jgi:hypothetical protein
MSILKYFLRTYVDHNHRVYPDDTHGNAYGNYSYHGHSHVNAMDLASVILKRVMKGGGKLLWILAGLVAFTLIVLVALVVALIPLLSYAFDFVSNNGLKGVTDLIMGLAQKLWTGAGK